MGMEGAIWERIAEIDKRLKAVEEQLGLRDKPELSGLAAALSLDTAGYLEECKRVRAALARLAAKSSDAP